MVFPRTGGEIVGLVRKSDLLSQQERALVTPPEKRIEIGTSAGNAKNEQNGDDRTTSSDIWEDTVHEEKMKKQVKLEPVGDGVPRLRTFSFLSNKDAQELHDRVLFSSSSSVVSTKQKDPRSAEITDDEHHHPDILVEKLYPSLKRQTEFEQRLVAICREELIKKEIRSITIVAATSNISLDAAYFFYNETDVSTPLGEFKEYLAKEVLKLETVWFTNVGTKNLFREMPQLKESAFVEQMMHQSSGVASTKEYLWPFHLSWPTPSRHVIRKSSSASSIALSHLVKCVLTKPRKFGVFDDEQQKQQQDEQQDAVGGIWQKALSLLHQTSFTKDVASMKARKNETGTTMNTIKSTTLSLCLVLCALCGKLRSADDLVKIVIGNDASSSRLRFQLSARDALSIFLILKTTKSKASSSSSSPSSTSWFLDAITTSPASSSSLLFIDQQKLFDFFYDEVINDITSEYTSVEERNSKKSQDETSSGDANNESDSKTALLTSRIPQNRFHQLAANVGLWKSSDIREDYAKVVDFMDNHHLEQENEMKMKIIGAMMLKKTEKKKNNIDGGDDQKVQDSATLQNEKKSYSSSSTSSLVLTSHARQAENKSAQKSDESTELSIDRLSEQRHREGQLVFQNLNRVIRQPYVVKYNAEVDGNFGVPMHRRTIVKNEDDNDDDRSGAGERKDAEQSGAIEVALLRRRMEEQTLMRRVLFEFCLELVAKVGLPSSSDNSSATTSEFSINNEKKTYKIRKNYVAHFHRELPCESLIHWTKLMVGARKETATKTASSSTDSSTDSSSSSSSSLWKSAIKALIKNVRVLESHETIKKNKLLQEADSILEHQQRDNEDDVAIQRMRGALKKLMSSTNSGRNAADETVSDDAIRSLTELSCAAAENEQERNRIVKRQSVSMLRMLYKGLEYKSS